MKNPYVHERFGALAGAVASAPITVPALGCLAPNGEILPRLTTGMNAPDWTPSSLEKFPLHCNNNAFIPSSGTAFFPPVLATGPGADAPMVARRPVRGSARSEAGGAGTALAKFGLAAFAFLVGHPGLLWFSYLRENSVFWLNAGGYPVWLRKMVLAAYYPILLVNVGVLLLYGFLVLSCPPRSRRSLWFNFTILALMAGGIAVAVLYIIADDL